MKTDDAHTDIGARDSLGAGPTMRIHGTYVFPADNQIILEPPNTFHLEKRLIGDTFLGALSQPTPPFPNFHFP